MAAKCMKANRAKLIFSIGIIILVISIALLMVFLSIYENKLNEELNLTNGTLLTKIWQDIPLPLYEKIYFFNITNAEDFMEKGSSLNVTEVGPYTYRGSWIKNNPQWNDNGTVSYRETRTYHFVPEMSVGSQDNSVYTLNGPLIIAADALNKDVNIMKKAFKLYLSFWGGDIVIKKTIRQLVYEGYEDSIIEGATYVRDDIPFKKGVFSWLYEKNATDDGLFTVFTGEGDRSKTDILNNWNGEEKLSFWENDTCNMLNGTSIEVGPPLPDHPETYSFFQSIFCRSLTFEYAGDYSVWGLNIKRFEPTSQLFANASENPENKCFEKNGGRPSGVIDVSPCQFDAPIWMSFPHFYLADPWYLETTNNLSPNESYHGSYISVEPITGISVDIKVRFQVNLELSRITGISQFNKIQEGIYPVFWAGLEIQITDEWAKVLKSKVKTPLIIAYSSFSVLIFLAIVLILFSAVVICLSKNEKKHGSSFSIKEERSAVQRIHLRERSVNDNLTSKDFL